MKERRYKKKRNKGRIAAALLALICLGTAAFFAGRLWYEEQEYQKGDDTYDLLRELATVEEPEESGSSPIIGQESENEDNTGEGISIDLDALGEVNEEIRAWLYSPDTVIDYPVCQGEDNSYYLTHLADGTYNKNGCLFIDCGNSGDFSDENTVIYGHHMASGKMFASLICYADQAYYEAHPVMYLTAAGKQYRLELFSGYTTTVDSSSYTLSFGSEHEFMEWLREVCGKSDFRATTYLTADDRIVTLSTCAYSFQDARYVLHGKLVEN